MTARLPSVYNAVFTDLPVATLLTLIDEARVSVDPKAAETLERLTDAVIRRGVYPEETVPGNPNSVLDMVRGWGALWFEWKGPLTCPLCQADLCDYEHGPPFKREHAIVEGDHIQFFTCPDCKGKLP